MSSLPYLFLFSLTLISSSLIALSSSHWIMLWVALEMNMISFIPLMLISNQFQETEASIKYFLFQALGSALLLLGSFSPNVSLFIFVGMLTKLGMAPFHFWFPSVMNALSWPMCLLLTTWQKIVPLFVIFSSASFIQSSVLLSLASLNAIIGGLGGLNQTQIRPLLAYSSIGHMGWMLAASSVSSLISSIYFLIYTFISSSLFIFLFFMNINSSKLFSSIFMTNSFYTIILSIILLSLGGLPPLTGFFPKWLVLASLNSILAPVALILGSLLNLFYYLNICFSSTLSNTKSLSYYHSFPLSFFFLFIISSSILPILFI